MSHDAPSAEDPDRAVPMPAEPRTDPGTEPRSQPEVVAPPAEAPSSSWRQPGRRRTAAIALGTGAAAMVAGGLLAGVLTSASADGGRLGGPGGRFGQQGQPGQGQQGQPPTAP